MDLLGGSVFAFSVNGDDNTDSALLFDNLAHAVSDITPNDGYVLINFSHAVNVGDTFTVKAGIYSLGANLGFNPALADFSFNGQAFLADSNGNRLSNVVPAPVPGDVDGDGIVGVTDLLMLLAAWGPCPDPCPPSCAADVDDDCSVGVTDLLVLLANWG